MSIFEDALVDGLEEQIQKLTVGLKLEVNQDCVLIAGLGLGLNPVESWHEEALSSVKSHTKDLSF